MRGLAKTWQVTRTGRYHLEPLEINNTVVSAILRHAVLSASFTGQLPSKMGNPSQTQMCQYRCTVCEMLRYLDWGYRTALQVETKQAHDKQTSLDVFKDFLLELENEFGAVPLVCHVRDFNDALTTSVECPSVGNASAVVLHRPIVYLVGSQNWEADDGDILRTLCQDGLLDIRAVKFSNVEGCPAIVRTLSGLTLSQHATLTELLSSNFACPFAPLQYAVASCLRNGDEDGSEVFPRSPEPWDTREDASVASHGTYV